MLEIVADKFGQKAADLCRRRYACVARAVAAEMLGRYSGLHQRDIGGLLAMGTGAAVCQQLQRLRDRRACDSDLAGTMDELASMLEQKTSLSKTGNINY